MRIRDYDIESKPNMNIRHVSERVEQVIRKDDYTSFINCLFSMFCILYMILIGGFVVLIYNLFYNN